jgi:hypothetical protein
MIDETDSEDDTNSNKSFDEIDDESGEQIQKMLG